MKYILTITSILICSMLMAQTEGTISYTETMKLDIQLDGIDESMKDLIPTSQSTEMELLFNSAESIYRPLKGEGPEELDISSDDGSFQIKLVMGDDVESIMYINNEKEEYVHQQGIMGKPFRIVDRIEKRKWKLTGEKVRYLDYECQKAVYEDEDSFVVAWFTSQIPAQIGPASYRGLPGAVLMVSIDEGQVEIKANKVEMGDLSEEIASPSEGKKVSAEKFEEIRLAKEKEMEEMYGGRGRRIIEH